MKIFLVQLSVFVLALAPILGRAGGDEVIVIYNKNVPESWDVADYYAQQRHVPKKQIFGFNLTTNQNMSRAEFRDSLQMPLAKELEDRGLWKMAKTTIPSVRGSPGQTGRCVITSKIRYAVLCYGMPLDVLSDPGLHETSIPQMVPELHRDDASVDSELAWLPLVNTHPNLTGPMLNWVYCATNTALLNPTNGILLVTRLDGPSAAIARGLVDKALQAERDGLWGRGYFDARGLSKTNAFFLGDEWILAAAQIWHNLGFETYVDDKPETFPADYPMGQIAVYCGWYSGAVCGPFTLPNVEFMPGAFAYHLHSYSAAAVRDPNRNWVGPLLAKGVTCTMGCINEPYLSFTPNVAVFLERWTDRQFTFGEAAWQAQPALSWQTTVVGDPLYRPFATSPQVMLDELEKRHSPLVEWPILREIDLAHLQGRLPDQLTSVLENLPETTNSSVLTEKLAQLYAIQGKIDAAVDACEKALQLHPSPEERIRIRLALAQLLKKAGDNGAARLDYQRLLVESPDYPGKAIIESNIDSLPASDTQTNK
ncbi:MAG TPA: TIGR03790 family protein [Verrucomicrobiae bacterium]|jgi:uncharacterized protein (TIGR03790 family)